MVKYCNKNSICKSKIEICDKSLSKTLSWLLRHGAESVDISADGYIKVDTVLNHKAIKDKYSLLDIQRVVGENDKQRFTIRTHPIYGYFEIKANQGHSIDKVCSLDLVEVTHVEQAPVVVHGTFYRHWNLIKIQGLSRMNRNHIHFATSTDASSTSKAISGIRNSSQIYIYIDLALALKHNLKFFKSANGVILSPGDVNGYIKPKYFLKVVDVQKGIPQCPKRDLLEFFKRYGRIVFHRFNGYSLVLRFSDHISIGRLLAQPIWVYGKRLKITVQPPSDEPAATCDNENLPRNVPLTPNDKQKIEEDKRAYTQKNVLQVLNKSSNVDEQIENLLNCLQGNGSEMIMKYNCLIMDLEKSFCHAFSQVPHPFGSTVTGLSFIDSDVDVFVELKNRPQDPNLGARLVYKAKHMLLQSGLFTDVFAIAKAKTPIVKAVHKLTGLQTDVNFKNGLGVCNSSLISYLLRLDHRVKPLMVILKYWAKHHEITGVGRFSNYALVLMVVFYLQQLPEPVLPTVCFLQSFDGVRREEDGWNCGFNADPTVWPMSENKQTVLELLQGFFKFFCTFDYDKNLISLLTGKCYQKSDFVNIDRIQQLPEEFDLYKKKLEHPDELCLKVSNPVCVQDPFELAHNVARSVTDKQLVEFLKYCQLAVELFEKEKSEELLILPSLFLLKPKCNDLKQSCTIDIPLSNHKKYSDPSLFNDSQSEMEQIWFETLQELVLKVLRDVLLLEVNPVTSTPEQKTAKIEGQTDVHDNNTIETNEFRCVGKLEVWNGRKKLQKRPEFMQLSLLEKETKITELILEKAPKDWQSNDNLVEFNICVLRNANPKLARIVLNNGTLKKSPFIPVAMFCLKYLKTIVDRSFNDPPRPVVQPVSPEALKEAVLQSQRKLCNALSISENKDEKV